MDRIESLLGRFHTEGYLVLPGALAPVEVARVLVAVERAFAEPSTDGYGEAIRVRMFERGPEFEELIDHPAIAPVMEAILGQDCHLIAQNALMTGPGQSVASGFHADDVVRVPIPAGVALDPRIAMPCFVVNMNLYLCDVDEALGPTEAVPGSHRSGRQPGPEDMGPDGRPSYEGRRPMPLIGPAGTAVLWHDQVWHRGAPNRSADRVRFVQQGSYGRRFVAQRFYPFVNYRLPDGILERATERRRRMLGLHPRGAYG